MKNKLFLGLGICLMGFLMACDDSSSASSENNTSPAADTPATQSDVFTLKDSFKYFVTETAQECTSSLSITDVQFVFGPGNAVNITTNDAEGMETYSGVYVKEIDEDGDTHYILQLNMEGNVINWLYEPGDDGIFLTVHEQVRAAAVHKDEHAALLLADGVCGQWTDLLEF